MRRLPTSAGLGMVLGGTAAHALALGLTFLLLGSGRAEELNGLSSLLFAALGRPLVVAFESALVFSLGSGVFLVRRRAEATGQRWVGLSALVGLGSILGLTVFDAAWDAVQVARL